jgi:hypothetical protein
MLIDTDEPRELADMLQPYMDLLAWDVHAVTEQPSYAAIIGSFRQKAAEGAN